MANPNIKVSITADDNASKKLKNLDDQVGKTGTGLGNLGKAAAIGGAALVAVGVKAVMAFEDLGLSVGKLADSTGLTTEQASRLIEVSDDLGISSGTLESAIGKMSKQLGADEAAFKSYGIEVQKNKDGTTDINGTFLEAVDRINAIEDPLKKAEAAAKIFGKGYQGMAELLGKSSDEIKADLAAVSDAKVFDDKKVQDARDMREAFDSIKDAGEDLLLTIGSALAPVITELAPVLVKVVEAAKPAADAIGKVLVSALEVVGPILEALLPVIEKVALALSALATVIGTFKPTGLTKGIEEAGASLDLLKQKALDAGLSQEDFQTIIDESAGSMVKTGDASKDLATLVETATGRFDEMTMSTAETDRETRKLGTSEEELKRQIDDTTEAAEENKRRNAALERDVIAGLDRIKNKWKEIQGTLSDEEAWLSLQTQFDNVEAAFVEASVVGDKSALEIEQGVRDAALAMAGLRSQVIDYGIDILGLPDEQMTRIFAAVNPDSLAEAEALIANLTRNREMSVSIIAKGGAGFDIPVNGKRAGGGPVSAGGAYLVGEKGPELLQMGSTSGNVIPNNALNGGGGSHTVNLTVNAGLGTNGYEVSKVIVNSLAEYDRRNGTNIVTPAGR